MGKLAASSAADARSGKASRETYRKARRALAAVQDDPTPERFHDWRKQVKVLSNELKIVGRAVPELATRYRDKVEKLGEILGQVHDLDCAAATAEQHPRWFGSDADCEAVRGLVAEHRVVLEREAFALAAGVFAGRARDVRELVETGWKTWRKRAAEGRRGRDQNRRPDDGRAGGSSSRRSWRRACWRRRTRPSGARLPVSNTASYRDGHTRPRALAFNPDDGLLYVALSTSDEIAVVDPAASPPRVLAREQRLRLSRTRSRRCPGVARSSPAVSIRACAGFAGRGAATGA